MAADRNHKVQILHNPWFVLTTNNISRVHITLTNRYDQSVPIRRNELFTPLIGLEFM